MENKTNNIEVKDAKEVKTRKGSTTLTIKAFNGSIKNLKELKMTTEEEQKQLEKLQKTIMERWVATEMKM